MIQAMARGWSAGVSKAFFVAAQTGHHHALRLLLPVVRDPNRRRADGCTALVLAAANDHPRCVEILLAAGADPNIATCEGWHPYVFARNKGHAEIAERLLRAHGGIPPVRDVGAAMLRKADPRYQTLYPSLYDPETLERKPFYNIGAGNWRHPHWQNADYASDYYNYDRSLIDIPWDISELRRFPADDGSAALVYSSHTIEHLTDEQDRFMFREMHRILRPGGVMRVTCPNIELYYQAYRRRDVWFNFHFGNEQPFDAPDKLVLWFVNEFASQLIQSVTPAHRPIYAGAVAELDDLFDRMPMAEACDILCGRIDYALSRINPGHHISWWTPDKLCRELRAAGFSSATVSVAGGSIAPLMRDANYFDTVSPTISLFVDAIR